MRMLVVGAGATGGYFGGRLALAGRDVTFLVRPQRAEALKAGGLEIVGHAGTVKLEPQVVTGAELKGPYDLILLTTKAYSLTAALEDIAPAVGPATTILPVLNGMAHVEAVRQRFGPQSLIGGVCRIAADLDAEGRVIQQSPFDDLWYGELDRQRTARLEAVDRFLQNAGFGAKWVEDIEQAMWDKWVLISTLAGATCLIRANIGEIARSPEGVRFMNGLMAEIAGIARAVGHAPSEAYLDQIRVPLTAPTSTLTASMYRDVEKGNPAEGEEILGDLLRRGRAQGIEAPLLTAAYTRLATYSARRSGAG